MDLENLSTLSRSFFGAAGCVVLLEEPTTIIRTGVLDLGGCLGGWFGWIILMRPGSRASRQNAALSGAQPAVVAADQWAQRDRMGWRVSGHFQGHFVHRFTDFKLVF